MALFIVLTAVLAAISFVLEQRPTLANMYHSVHCLVFVVIFIFLATKSMEDVYLNYVCYCILFFSFVFSVVNLPVGFGLDGAGAADDLEGDEAAAAGRHHHRKFVEADGVWQLVTVIFLVYAMLPMKTYVAFAMGSSLPVVHLAVSVACVDNATVGLVWQQVRIESQSSNADGRRTAVVCPPLRSLLLSGGEIPMRV